MSNKQQYSYDYKNDFYNKINFSKKSQDYFKLQNTFAMNYFFKEIPTGRTKIHNLVNYINFKNTIYENDQTQIGLKFSGNKLYFKQTRLFLI